MWYVCGPGKWFRRFGVDAVYVTLTLVWNTVQIIEFKFDNFILKFF